METNSTDPVERDTFERIAYRVGLILGEATAWLLLGLVVAVPVAWWLAQVLR